MINPGDIEVELSDEMKSEFDDNREENESEGGE